VNPTTIGKGTADENIGFAGFRPFMGEMASLDAPDRAILAKSERNRLGEADNRG
jgi:hypothetical protein